MTLRRITQMGDTSRLAFFGNFDTLKRIPFFAHAASCLQRKVFTSVFSLCLWRGNTRAARGNGFLRELPNLLSIPQIGDERTVVAWHMIV